jgi:hypothetical protein
MAALMPMHNERSAPRFNPTKPRELVHYFEDLSEDQFQWCAVIDLADQKWWVLHYVLVEIADLWESLTDWTAATTWDLVKDTVKKCYSASQTMRRHTHHKLLMLICDRACKDFSSITEWSDFHLGCPIRKKCLSFFS